MCREEIQVDISWGVFLWHSFCLVLSELPGSALRCLMLIWGRLSVIIAANISSAPSSFSSPRIPVTCMGILFCLVLCFSMLEGSTERDILQLRGSFLTVSSYQEAITAVLPSCVLLLISGTFVGSSRAVISASLVHLSCMLCYLSDPERSSLTILSSCDDSSDSPVVPEPASNAGAVCSHSALCCLVCVGIFCSNVDVASLVKGNAVNRPLVIFSEVWGRGSGLQA